MRPSYRETSSIAACFLASKSCCVPDLDDISLAMSRALCAVSASSDLLLSRSANFACSMFASSRILCLRKSAFLTAVWYSSMRNILRMVSRRLSASHSMDFISSWGVNTAYRYMRLLALELDGSLSPSIFRMRPFSCFVVSGSRTSSSLRYESLPSCTTLFLLPRLIVLPTSYLVSPTWNASTISPESAPFESRLSPLMDPLPNSANSIPISIVDLPEPMSPLNMVIPVGNCILVSR